MRRMIFILVFAAAVVCIAGVEQAEAAEPTAGLPSPSDGKKDVGLEVMLWWSPGWANRAKNQDIFFGTDESAVRNATDVSVPPGLARIPGSQYKYALEPLKLGTTYYWRIDTIYPTQPGGPWIGEVWRFTTKACVDSTDNFESYGSTDALRGVWTEGGGAWIESATGESHGGNRSMELQYYNRSGFKFSDATRTFDPPKDWSSSGPEAIRFFYKGFLSNDEDQLYITLADANGVSATVLYDGGADALKTETWLPCGVFLDEFTNVNLAAVESLLIGIGDHTSSTNSRASGQIYIDDISLCVPACVPEIQIPGDVTADCKVDFEDHALMARDWGRHDGPVVPMMPNPTALKAWYKFDESSGLRAKDSSGNNFHGDLYQRDGTPVPSWRLGKKSGSLFFEGKYGVLIVDPNGSPIHVFSEVDKAVTICTWVKGFTEASSRRTVIFQAHESSLSGAKAILSIYIQTSGGAINFDTGLGERDRLALPGPDNWDAWNHYAFVKNTDKGFQQIYRNGCLVAEKTDARASLKDIGMASIGLERQWYREGYVGWIDDFRVYNYALSQREIVHIVDESVAGCPLTSAVNIHDEEEPGNRIVDFKDYSLLAENWLAEELRPQR